MRKRYYQVSYFTVSREEIRFDSVAEDLPAQGNALN